MSKEAIEAMKKDKDSGKPDPKTGDPKGDSKDDPKDK